MNAPTADWTIREARPEDAAGIIDYLKTLADEPNNGTSFTSSAQVVSLEEERKFIQDYAENPNGLMLVAATPTQIVAVSNVRAGRRMFFCNATLGVSVHSNWRRKGIGRALMQHMIEFARKHPDIIRLELEVFTDNTGAIALYEQLGFQHEATKRYIGFRDGVYKDEHLMVMLFVDKLSVDNDNRQATP